MFLHFLRSFANPSLQLLSFFSNETNSRMEKSCGREYRIHFVLKSVRPMRFTDGTSVEGRRKYSCPLFRLVRVDVSTINLFIDRNDIVDLDERSLEQAWKRLSTRDRNNYVCASNSHPAHRRMHHHHRHLFLRSRKYFGLDNGLRCIIAPLSSLPQPLSISRCVRFATRCARFTSYEPSLSSLQHSNLNDCR